MTTDKILALFSNSANKIQILLVFLKGFSVKKSPIPHQKKLFSMFFKLTIEKPLIICINFVYAIVCTYPALKEAML